MKLIKSRLLLLLAVLLSGKAAVAGPVPLPTTTEGCAAALKQPALPDTMRVQYLTQLGLLQSRSDEEAGLRTLRQALTLAQRCHYRLGQVLLLGGLSDMETNATNYVAAQRLAEQALALNRAMHRTKGTALAYARLGQIALDQDNRPQALAYFELAQRTYAAFPAAELTKYWEGQSKVYGGLGQTCMYLRQYPAALRWLRQGLALQAPPQPAWWLWKAVLLEHLGMTYVEMGRLDSARSVLNRGLRLAVANPQGSQSQVSIRMELGRLALAEHRPAEAYAQLHQALRLAREMGADKSATQIMLFLSQAMRALRQPAAYDTLARYMDLRYTFDAEANSQALLTMQARFHDAEQQAQIRNLEKDRRLAAQTQELTRLRQQRQLAGGSALLLLTLAGAGGLLWQYRRRQSGREAALRTRLAADLHDDVGSLLTQINMQSDLLRQPNASPAATLARLDRLSDASRQAARQMADVVWGLQETSTTLPEVLTHMRDHAHEVLPPAGLMVDFGVSPAVEALVPPAAVCQHLYLIYKECLHNVVKHARGATQVTVRLSYDESKLCLSVQDNAPGPAVVGRAGGHGLANMQRRAEAVGGTVRVEASAGGLEVRACLPA